MRLPFGMFLFLSVALLLTASRSAVAAESCAREGFDRAGSDARAIELANTVMDSMGGCASWKATHCVAWSFFGRRFHVWDRWSGDIRVESEDLVVAMNLNTGGGRAWRGGEEITASEELTSALDDARAAWVNDSYWLFMPYKLQDDGVTLTWVGEGKTAEGQLADIVQLTFRDVGLTPEDKYHVYVDRKSGLVVQWDFYDDASDEEPALSTPWKNWQRYGDILLSDDRGRSRLTGITVLDTPPAGAFDDPAPLALPRGSE